VAAIGLVGWSIYRSWSQGPWDVPAPPKISTAYASTANPTPPTPKAPVNADAIVTKNLFDPERGAGATRDAEENSRAAQRVRNMILVGTVIIGNEKFAIVQDNASPMAAPGVPSKGQNSAPMRLKLGDSVDGFRLSEIADRRVVFSKDGSRIQVMLDYFRKTEIAQPRPATPTQMGAPPPPGAVIPQVVPNLPRRARIPVPPNQRPDS
jgi:hypothetical protein